MRRAGAVEVLIERAGAAVAWARCGCSAAAYGRTVNVICGKGNNGADGRVAARQLAAKGVRVRVFDGAAARRLLPAADLVIDAAYGTGFHGTWSPPDVGDTPVLAVDLPERRRRAHRRHRRRRAGGGPHRHVRGVEARPADAAGQRAGRRAGAGRHRARRRAGRGRNLVQSPTSPEWWPERDEYAHKWRSAVRVIAGSSTMTGAPRLVCACGDARRCRDGAACRSPGMTLVDAPIEIVQRPLPSTGWADAALGVARPVPRRSSSGPGSGRSDDTGGERSQAGARSAAADGDRRRRAVRPGVELGGRRPRCCGAAPRRRC